VTKISGSDSLVWMRKIPRNQVHHPHYNNVGFAHIQSDTYHDFFFVDDKKNLQLNPTDVPVKLEIGESRYLIHCQADNQTGDIIKTVVLDFYNVKGMEITEITPHQMIVIKPGIVVFEANTPDKDLVFTKDENVLIKIIL
jgi:hypothetical protein